ncbi:DUF4929 family protein [Porphyromonas pogonae]|uniref:DUF4929 family protein n=1 Tax=Porphyromonas pogonae TaxID=867595 RepID=UPI002E798BBC|nr:DUF4929 family protein [Porphyromonas pogonae]
MEKNIFKIVLLSFMTLFIVACSKDNNNEYGGTNNLYLSLPNEATTCTVADGQKEGVTLLLKMTKKLDHDVTFKIVTEGEGSDAITLIKKEVTIPKGEFQIPFEIKSANKGNVTKNIIIKVKCMIPPTEKDMSIKSFVEVTVTPSDVLKLTEAQKQLIEGYKTKYGIDLYKILGPMICKGLIKEPGGANVKPFTAPREIKINNEMMFVTLSDKATAEQPILKFEKNPLGLDSYFSSVFNLITILDTEFWNNPGDDAPPASKYICKSINWTPQSKETFTLSLDNIRLDVKTGKIDFLGKKADAIGNDDDPTDMKSETIIIVPFHFNSSVWSRILEKIRSNTDKDLKINVLQGSVDPYQILFHSTIDKDDWKDGMNNPNDPSYYIAPKASIDFTKGTMHFEFPWDMDHSYGYTQIHVDCTK